jgi:hypothetical protein
VEKVVELFARKKHLLVAKKVAKRAGTLKKLADVIFLFPICLGKVIKFPPKITDDLFCLFSSFSEKSLLACKTSVPER